MPGYARALTVPLGVVLATVLLTTMIATPAEARGRRATVEYHHRHVVKIKKAKRVRHVKRIKRSRVRVAVMQETKPPSFSFFGSSSSIVARMEQDVGRNPTTWNRVWCGYYLGIIIKSLGMQPPAGFPAATAWARFGAPAAPAPGVVAVMKHHVAVVMQVFGNGTFKGISGNHGRKVGIGVYSMNRVIAWRAPG